MPTRSEHDETLGEQALKVIAKNPSNIKILLGIFGAVAIILALGISAALYKADISGIIAKFI